VLALIRIQAPDIDLSANFTLQRNTHAL